MALQQTAKGGLVKIMPQPCDQPVVSADADRTLVAQGSERIRKAKTISSGSCRHEKVKFA